MVRLTNAAGAVVDVSDDTARKLGPGWAPAGAHPDGDDYPDWTVDDLKDEARRRNTGRDDDSRILLSGTKDELVARLRADG